MIARTGICLVAAAVAASGCGGGSDAGGGLDAVAAAADASSHTRGAQVDMAVTMSGGGIPKPMSFSGQGAMDMAGRRMHLTMDMSSLKAFMPAGSGDAIGSDASIEEVMDKFVLYMRFHGIQGTPKKWLRIDAAKLTRQQGFDLQQLTGGAGNDPAQTLRYLKAVGNVQKIGSETIDGAATTHYKGTIDLKKYPKLAPADQRAQARRAIDRLTAQTGTSTMPVEVWIDAKKLVRREVVDMTMAIPGAGKVRMNMRIDLSGYGKPVRIQVPAAKDVKDMTAAAQQQLSKQQP